jgi:hypothetical protein
LVSLISADHKRYVAQRLETPTDVNAARRLIANVYQEKGWAGPIDLTDEGTLSSSYDIWHPLAVYFGVKDLWNPSGDLVVSGRILEPGDLGASVLQTYAACHLDASLRAELEEAEVGTVAEVSGLAKSLGVNPTATLHLYREMGAYGLEVGHRHWIMAADVSLSRRLTRLLGDAIEVAGEPTYFRGGTVVPMHIRIPDDFARLVGPAVTERRPAPPSRVELAEFMLERIPPECLGRYGLAPSPRDEGRR